MSERFTFDKRLSLEKACIEACHETRNRSPGHETFSMELGTTSAGTAERMTSMADLAMVLLGLFVVSIFPTHAIQAYRAQ